MTTATAPARTIGTIPLVLPSIRDPRLHVASVIISIHVLGQLGLGFRISIPQILAAILTCAVIEVGWTFAQTRTLVWPASAMLTGSGVALIFRMLEMESGDHWSFEHWHLFALVAGGSLLTKYLIRWDGKPLFNPSNVGLVVAFLILGSSTAEPLDFWWGPLDGWMLLAYAIILGGGAMITGRLRLLPMAAAFWVTFLVANGALAASGHCFTARWSFEPVCGTHFWWVLITSPEVLIFLFFMITDPRTIPSARVARIAFGASTAILSTLLIAPQQQEFGAKVGLLSGLVLLTAARPVFDRLFPEKGSERDRLRVLLRPKPIALTAMAMAVVLVGVVAAGAPAREVARGGSGALPTVDVTVDASSLPAVMVDDEVAKLDETLAGSADELAVGLATALAVEEEAFRQADPELLPAAAVGTRLVLQERRLVLSIDAGTINVTEYEFDTLHLTVAFPFGPQGGATPGFEATGTQITIAYDLEGNELDRGESEFHSIFALLHAEDDRWLIAAVTPVG